MKDKLQDIWNKQHNLDDIVLKKAKKTREETLSDRQVALLTEIGELANEMQNFKYWKHNKNIQLDKVKEEYADVLHFIISLGIDIFEDANDMYEWYVYKNNINLQRQKDNY